jgi:hypothetical protein
VPTPSKQPHTHHYPTRNVISQTQDEQANLIMELVPDENDIPITQTIVIDNISTVQHWANAMIDSNTGASMEYRYLIKSDKHKLTWTRSFANELGRLAQGVADRETGTNTITFILKSDIPGNRQHDITYGRICVDYRPQKKEPERTHLTVPRQR